MPNILGDRRAGDIGIQNADLVAATCQLNGERPRHKGLSNAAFAGKHGDDALDLGQVVLLKFLRCGLSARRGCVLTAHVRILSS